MREMRFVDCSYMYFRFTTHTIAINYTYTKYYIHSLVVQQFTGMYGIVILLGNLRALEKDFGEGTAAKCNVASISGVKRKLESNRTLKY